MCVCVLSGARLLMKQLSRIVTHGISSSETLKPSSGLLGNPCRHDVWDPGILDKVHARVRVGQPRGLLEGSKRMCFY